MEISKINRNMYEKNYMTQSRNMGGKTAERRQNDKQRKTVKQR